MVFAFSLRTSCTFSPMGLKIHPASDAAGLLEAKQIPLQPTPRPPLFFKSSDIWDLPMPGYQKREGKPGEHWSSKERNCCSCNFPQAKHSHTPGWLCSLVGLISSANRSWLWILRPCFWVNPYPNHSFIFTGKYKSLPFALDSPLVSQLPHVL